MRKTELAVATMCVALFACGATAARGRRVYPPLAESDVPLFDNGADFIEDPESLDGQWRDDWTTEFQQRVERADLVATISLSDVQSELDEVEGTEAHRFRATIAETLYGTARDLELHLRTAPNDRGYSTVSNTESIAARAWVVFVKWRAADDGDKLAAWHLAPASEPIARRLGFLIERRKDAEGISGRRIIRRTTTD